MSSPTRLGPPRQPDEAWARRRRADPPGRRRLAGRARARRRPSRRASRDGARKPSVCETSSERRIAGQAVGRGGHASMSAADARIRAVLRRQLPEHAGHVAGQLSRSCPANRRISSSTADRAQAAPGAPGRPRCDERPRGEARCRQSRRRGGRFRRAAFGHALRTRPRETTDAETIACGMLGRKVKSRRSEVPRVLGDSRGFCGSENTNSYRRPERAIERCRRRGNPRYPRTPGHNCRFWRDPFTVTMLDRMRRHRAWLKWSLAHRRADVRRSLHPELPAAARRRAPRPPTRSPPSTAARSPWAHYQRAYSAQVEPVRAAYGDQIERPDAAAARHRPAHDPAARR